ncbi:MAG: (Fe-S)-binding protein, partial [Burkholderiales bacterium]
YRATRDEQHLTRGRANTLRLALSGQLGAAGIASPEVIAALDLCVSCKGCKRECPTGVDMARMKIEFLAQYRKRHGATLRDRLIAYLPRYAPWAARLAPIANGASRALRKPLGFSVRRELPAWRSNYFVDRVRPKRGSRELVLLVDTFNRYFEPENARAAVRVLEAANCRVHLAQPRFGERPLCCGRTFLAAGLVEDARREARRLVEALQPFLEYEVPVVGLEPSCLYTLRDEYTVLLPEAKALASRALMLEEFLVQEANAGRLEVKFKPLEQEALLHGHCHQKAFAAMGAVESALRLVPGLKVSTIESSCCGMAGSFGYEAEHYEVSMKMGELALLPAVRNAGDDALIVADGTSCRHQIADGTGRQALHVARVLAQALQD